MADSAELQTLLAALVAKLADAPGKTPAPAPPPARAPRTKVVPISAREDPDIDPYTELSEIDTTRYRWKFCKNGRWRKIPIQSPEEVKRRTEQMLKTKLQKREENMRRLKEQIAAIEAAPVEAPASVVEEPAPADASFEAPRDEDPELTQIIGEHLADRLKREARARELSTASSSVFGVAVTHE